MTFVITRLCRDCKDLGCLSACPKDCILEHHPPSGASDLPNQLFIDPDEMHRLLCVCPRMPLGGDLPRSGRAAGAEPDIALNAIVRSRRDEFREPETRSQKSADAAAVRHNKERWGVGERP